MNEKIGLIGIPLDLGANRRGTDMGPSAIRYARLSKALENMGVRVRDCGNVSVRVPENIEVGDERMRFADEIILACENLADTVSELMQKGDFPLVLGGDHSITMGTLGGVARQKEELGLIWFDAHGDFNTPETTSSGNVHGMSLAAIVGRGPEKLVRCAGVQPKVIEERAVLVGVRDLDPEERELLRQSAVTVFTIKDVDMSGMAEIIRRAVDIASGGGKPVHLSLDMDVLDPRAVSGLGTPVRGGLSYREAHLAMEYLAETDVLCSMDVTEVNPILDQGGNQTAKVAVELICSALGKTII